MADYTVSPNMLLPVPTVGVSPGPEYATLQNQSMAIIDSHNHSINSGVQVTPAGLNINSDLTMNGNNLINVNTVRFNSLAATLPNLSPNTGALYVSLNELYYNDVTGSHTVKLTNNGSVNAATGNITNLVSPASVNFTNGTFVFQSSTSTSGSIDVGNVILRSPTSSLNAFGITLQVPPSISSNWNIVLPSLPSVTSLLQIDTAGNMGTVTFDQAAINMSSVGANAIAAKMTSVGADAIASTINTAGANTILATSLNGNLGGLSVRTNNRNVIVSSTNAANGLSVIRGTVSSSGAILSGEGFTATRTGAGVYLIAFTQTFNDQPAVLLTCANPGDISIMSVGVSGGQVGGTVSGFQANARFVASPFSFQDTDFCFTAIGQRST